MLLKRCSYRASGGSAKEKRKTVEVAVDSGFARVLDLAERWYRQFPGNKYFSLEALAGEFMQTALVAWFEDVAKMRVGEYLARVAGGERFEWQKDGAGVVRLVSISQKVTVQ